MWFHHGCPLNRAYPYPYYPHYPYYSHYSHYPYYHYWLPGCFSSRWFNRAYPADTINTIDCGQGEEWTRVERENVAKMKLIL